MSRIVIFDTDEFKAILKQNNLTNSTLAKKVTDMGLVVSDATIRRAIRNKYMSVNVYNILTCIVDISSCVIEETSVENIVSEYIDRKLNNAETLRDASKHSVFALKR